jgi:hypothetical protein
MGNQKKTYKILVGKHCKRPLERLGVDGIIYKLIFGKLQRHGKLDWNVPVQDLTAGLLL